MVDGECKCAGWVYGIAMVVFVDAKEREVELSPVKLLIGYFDVHVRI